MGGVWTRETRYCSGWQRSRSSVPRRPLRDLMPESDRPPYDLPRLIEVLDRHQVEYLIVGGAAAVAYGAMRPTEDADCVVSRDRANLVRLASALRELNARLRVAGMSDAEARRLPVQIDATSLDMAGMTTWMTDAGPFDVLARSRKYRWPTRALRGVGGASNDTQGRVRRAPGRQLGRHHHGEGASG
jgi:hypothetical protein